MQKVSAADVPCRSVEVESHRVFTSRMASSSLSSQRVVSAFPLLTPEEFECACRAFLDRIHVLGSLDGVGWSSIRFVQQATGAVLKISRSIHNSNTPYYDTLSASVDIEEPQVEICEDDPEALIRASHSSNCLHIEHDVILSPTYQVPVLYFTLRRANHPGPLGIDEVYQYLVPDQYRKELQDVGVMGGISFGYHPQSGIPAFFVHPCNTADAMKQIAGQKQVTPEAYLVIWLGMVGNRLSLHLPHELFAKEGVQKLQGLG
ncbi:autophagy-related protein Atg10 [Aspergillus pseudonomiae]|uniref:Ubiquitin-like-conjugating enzyme ATG10 n=1 Tax=Aspergillus pseudonomiae TaxID=1506151 RepID=A0A5N6HP98_9EURO|nr:autophagy-related protein Atg10 [Aspergillus pseudonomiae]KAB8256256.1 autophagy-related protein Atg10 [Aspergillus pseudonomiae]KAE8400053.1 autophagy-related protein Atg10 [Aspergillus pseudonomiae]